jgi:AcrR family transcriptional regulator
MDTRERILSAAAQVFGASGVRGATTRRIAERAGVNEVTVFRLFGDKKTLLKEAVRRGASETEFHSLPSPPGKLETDLQAWTEAHLVALHDMRALLRSSMSEFEQNPEVGRPGCSPPQRVAEDLSRYLDAQARLGHIQTSLDIRMVTSLMMGTLFSDAVSRDVMSEQYSYDLQEAAIGYTQLFLRLLRPD